MVTIQGYYSQKRIHNKYKDVLLNKKCVRHSMNRIEGKDHKIGTYEIDKFFLSCFDDKMSIQNNGCDEFALGYYKKTATSITLFFLNVFVKQVVLIFFLVRTALLPIIFLLIFCLVKAVFCPTFGLAY